LCKDLDAMRAASDYYSKSQKTPPGCLSVDPPVSVTGPLEVKIDVQKSGREIAWALIEVPGHGQQWTFLEHLKDIGGYRDPYYDRFRKKR
jgi:hypothetical protein